MYTFLKNILFKKKRKRLELRFLNYADAYFLLKSTRNTWVIAKEEDYNRIMGWVYLERLEQ